MKHLNKPDVRHYLDLTLYLRDLYHFRKTREKGFSYETWSQELDIENRSFLRQLVNGKRKMTLATIEIFKRRLFIDPLEKEYFHLLARYSSAKDNVEREVYSTKLLQMLKPGYEQQTVTNNTQLLSSLEPLRILTYLSHQDANRAVHAMVKFLEIEEETLLKHLKELQSAGLVWNADDIWTATDKIYKIPEKFGDKGLLKYHQESLLAAIAATQLPAAERRYRSLLLPLTPEQFESFTMDLNRFAQETLAKYQSDTLCAKKIFQINFNVHSVTKTISQDPTPLTQTNV